MQITHEHAPGDRYRYDFGLCSAALGFAQIDTNQDASYFGNWCNPDRLILFAFVEGDCTLTECASEAEFAQAVRDLVAAYSKGGGWCKIDPGFDPAMRARFEALGLAECLH